MKRIILFFLVVIYSVLSQNLQAIGIETAQLSGAKVPAYAKPALPPEKTEAEKKAEDPTRQAVKSAGVQGGILLTSNLLLKGFSTKYQKEACLSGNTAKTLDEAKKNSVYFVWDTKLSLKLNETQRCIPCCGTSEDGKSADDIKLDSEKNKEGIEKCNEDATSNDWSKYQLNDCLKKFTDDFSSMSCRSDKEKECERDFNNQMLKHCNKKKFKKIKPCEKEKNDTKNED